MLLNSNNNLWNFLKPSKPSRTIGDDIESLFDQMKNGRIQTTKYQLSHSYYMLLEKDLKEARDIVKSSDNDDLCVKCEGIRTTLE